jgi:hypothetical protein
VISSKPEKQKDIILIDKSLPFEATVK